MNPIKASECIAQRLEDRIRYALPIERSAPEFTEPLNNVFHEQYPLKKPPYLEITPPYQPGCTLRHLAEEEVIHEDAANLFSEALGGCDPARFRLYKHQEEAVRAAIAGDKNIVVCSGTGSGKTECFLIPLIDYLVRQHHSEGLTPGVRAMILYPMNALVNDQIRRLRTLLRKAEYITFGKYTGELAPLNQETELQIGHDDKFNEILQGINTATNNLQWSGAGFDDEIALPNEVTTRSGWRANPAHILVTNYSMLEYLLLRPEDAPIFGKDWKFIVLDEAHCYSGAIGTEIAWLIRRVKRRVVAHGSDGESIRYLATSATLVDDSKMSEDVKATRVREDFASKLFPADKDTFHVQFGKTAIVHPV